MFVTNTGLIDRIIRVIVGVALISGYWMWPGAAWGWAFFIGVIPLLSGLAGWCPVYRLLGWSTSNQGDNTGHTRSA
ncbi:YgaP-like transmembrane domain [Roseovarius salis]|uniref:YgaP family membrane protein n=1 Tax=Roseovarius salis TaxID=3376063 RepID=UPI0037C9BB6B